MNKYPDSESLSLTTAMIPITIILHSFTKRINTELVKLIYYIVTLRTLTKIYFG